MCNKEIVKRLMYSTIERLEQDNISKEELDYLQNVIDLLNQILK